MKQRTLINQKRVHCLSLRTVLLNQDICEDIKRKSLLCDLCSSLVNTLNSLCLKNINHISIYSFQFIYLNAILFIYFP